MAEGVVSFGVQKLWELLSRESERLSGIDEQVDGLKRKLRMLQSLLEDAYAKKHESKRVRNLLEDVQDILYDAEDVIESFLLKESRGKEKGIKKRIKRFSCFLIDRRRFALDIEGITKRISEVIEGMQSFGIQQIIDGGRSLSLQERQRVQRESRQTFSNDFESDLVGVEKSVEELVSRFVENDNNIQVVSITGMGGIGKTTLARQIFHHERVRRRFNGFAWVCVSQEFTQKQIWQMILQDLSARRDEEISQMDEYTLHGKLFQLLETSNYLIVLDDVWKNEDWDRIKAVFPPKKGWKMLLTSRDEGGGLHVDPSCFPFRPKILSHEESWNLCQRIVFSRRDKTEFRIGEELEAIGKKMVTHCGGLPLAVKVLGGLLATKHTIREWERLCENIGPQIIGGTSYGVVDDNNPNSVNKVLSLSYEDLSMHLKHCFLYLAHYPEDHDIDMEILFSRWAAEGIIALCYDGSTIRETGKVYMEELVRRNMVIARRKDAALSNQSCQMHDMMREVYLSKAKEENFLQVVKIHSSTSTINSQSIRRSRRLVVHSDTGFQMLGHKSNPKIRSLISFALGEDFWVKSAQFFRSLPLLRLLDLSNVHFEGNTLPSSIGELIHLRFLSLENALVSYLSPSLRNLKLLHHLNLNVRHDQLQVPNVLNEMLELRYLYLPKYMHDKTKLELGDLVNLEYLEGFSTKRISVADLFSMTRLMTLIVHLYFYTGLKNLLSSARELRNLEKLRIYGEVSYKGELVMDFTHLTELSLTMELQSLPDTHQLPPHLTHIYLARCHMVKDPMPILEKLSHLKSVRFVLNVFVGKRMVCSNGGFPQLSSLEIINQRRLKEWIVEEGSMPCLRTLTIEHCEKLKGLPCGLKFITSLKELDIVYMKKVWADKLIPGGEDYYKVQHIPSVQFIGCVLD